MTARNFGIPNVTRRQTVGGNQPAASHTGADHVMASSSRGSPANLAGETPSFSSSDMELAAWAFVLGFLGSVGVLFIGIRIFLEALL